MIRRIGSYGTLLVALSMLSCGEEKLLSHWANVPLVIDGDGAEWPVSYTTYVEETRGIIGAANDDSTLYLLFRFRDKDIAAKAMFGGASVWWSASDGKDRDIGIRFFPVTALRDVMQGRMPPGGEPGDGEPPASRDGSNQERSAGRSGESHWRETDSGRGWDHQGRGFGTPSFPTPEEGILHTDVRLVTATNPVGVSALDDARIHAQSSYQKGTYTYEVSIPQCSSGDSEFCVAATEKGEIHFLVSLGGVSEEEKNLIDQAAQRPRERPGSGDEGAGGVREGGGGMGGPGGMGRGGPGPGGMSSPLEELRKTVDLGFEITLADRAE